MVFGSHQSVFSPQVAWSTHDAAPDEQTLMIASWFRRPPPIPASFAPGMAVLVLSHQGIRVTSLETSRYGPEFCPFHGLEPL